MDMERYLAEVFDELTDAVTLDARVLIAARAASALADACGVCLLSADGDDSLVALAREQPLYLCNLQRSGLYRAALSLRQVEARNSRTLWGKEDLIMLPTGHQQRIDVSLIVPLAVASHAALAFFWQPGQHADRKRTRCLELLAKAFDLIACSRWKDEEHAARHRDQLRIATELRHRLRNNLALVRSIIRRSHETAESTEHFALHLEARIGALTRIRGALVTAGACGVEIEELIRTELLASAVPERRCLVKGPAVRLHDKGAELLALAVHELATNSLKFGALATVSGGLVIRWSVTDDTAPHLQLSWSESGVSVASAAPRRRGFGQELIEATLPYELGAQSRLAFTPGAVLCEIHIPLEPYASVAVPEVVVAHAANS